MTIGTQLAIAIDRASNQCQADMLATHWLTMRQLDINQMPSDCLMFLIAQPCWMEEV